MLVLVLGRGGPWSLHHTGRWQLSRQILDACQGLGYMSDWALGAEWSSELQIHTEPTHLAEVNGARTLGQEKRGTGRGNKNQVQTQ